jgi:hypothetical protein
MARVRSTARPCDDVPVAEGEGAITERGAIDEGRDSAGSAKRSRPMQVTWALIAC